MTFARLTQPERDAVRARRLDVLREAMTPAERENAQLAMLRAYLRQFEPPGRRQGQHAPAFKPSRWTAPASLRRRGTFTPQRLQRGSEANQ